MCRLNIYFNLKQVNPQGFQNSMYQNDKCLVYKSNINKNDHFVLEDCVFEITKIKDSIKIEMV